MFGITCKSSTRQVTRQKASATRQVLGHRCFRKAFDRQIHLLLKLLPLPVAADQQRLRDDVRCIFVSFVHALPHRLQSVG